LQTLVAVGVDIIIIALICLSLFSGPPAFETSRAKPAMETTRAKPAVPPAASVTR